MSELKKYARSLRRHPGTPVASACTTAGFIAMTPSGLLAATASAAIMSVFWIPVLVTAWNMRNDLEAKPK